MKNCCKSLVFILLLAFLPGGRAYADEWERHNSFDVSAQGTIIKHYTVGKDVVCVNSAGAPYFMMLVEGVPVSYVMYIHVDSVSDFEIYNDTVYYAGRKQSISSVNATYGYFDLSSLASPGSTTVTYIDLPWMSNAAKIEVDSIAYRKHVLLIGEGLKEGAMVVDAIDEGIYWNVNYATFLEDTVTLYDIDVTDSYVVLSSAMEVFHWITPPKIWYFDKSVPAGFSVLQNYPQCNVINDHRSGRILIETLHDDYFVAVSALGLNLPPDISFQVHVFNGYLLSSRLTFTEHDVDRVELMDVATAGSADSVNVLITSSREGIIRSITYELPTVVSTPLTTIQCHVMQDACCTSLDFTNEALHYVVAGFGTGTSYPYFYKYKSGVYDDDCLMHEDHLVGKSGTSAEPDVRKTEYGHVHMLGIEEVNDKKEMHIKTDCIQISKDR